MQHAAYHRAHSAGRPRQARSLIALPLVLFAAVTLVSAGYVAYVLWPRWPSEAVTLDAPEMPIVVSGAAFNVPPAAMRMPIQRYTGVHDRVDLSFLWPSLEPPDPELKATPEHPINPNERLFVTIANGDNTLPPLERLQTIYPRYLASTATPLNGGLSLRPFRDNTPYQGEDLIYDTNSPERFIARCSRQGVGNSGMCLYERRVGNADVTMRFPRDWMEDAPAVVAALGKLMARLHPAR